MNKMILKDEYMTDDGEHSVNMTFVDEDYNQLQVKVKWDGCCDIVKHFNTSTVSEPTDNDENDYIHICELKEYIDLLTQVYEKALEKGYEV